MVVQDIRERVVQAGLEDPREGADIAVHMHEVAIVLPRRLDRQPRRLLQQSRRREYRRHQVRRHLQHDVGEEVLFHFTLIFFRFGSVRFHGLVNFPEKEEGIIVGKWKLDLVFGSVLLQ